MPTRPVEPPILLWAARRPIFYETSLALQAALARVGVVARCLTAVPDSGAEAAGIVLVGRGTDLQPTEISDLRRLATRMPVVLWQLEALPHPMTTSSLRELGAAMIEPDWRSWLGPAGLPIDGVLPLRGELQRLVRGQLGRRYRRQLETVTGEAHKLLDKNDVRFIHLQAEWILAHGSGPGGWLKSVACGSAARVEFLVHHGVAALHVPVPPHLIWGSPPCDVLTRDMLAHDTSAGDGRRDIDLLLFGHDRTRSRRRIWSSVATEVKSRGYRVLTVAQGLHGTARTELMRRTRVTLQVPSIPWEFPGIRMLIAIQCGVLVVASSSEQSAPYEASTHYLPTTLKRLADTVVRVLDDEPFRSGFVESARRSLDATLSPCEIAKQIMNVLGYTPTTQPHHACSVSS